MRVTFIDTPYIVFLKLSFLILKSTCIYIYNYNHFNKVCMYESCTFIFIFQFIYWFYYLSSVVVFFFIYRFGGGG